MTDAIIEAGILTANLDTRSVTGLLLPYGEEGNSNLGRVKIKAHAVELPGDFSAMNANLDHRREDPVAVFTALKDTPEGAVASFRVANTPEGDDFLLDPKRRKLSAEVKGIVIRAGEVIGGKLFGAAFVEAGAFPSAALLASDVGPTPVVPQTQEGQTMTETAPAPAPAGADPAPVPMLASAQPPAQLAPAPVPQVQVVERQPASIQQVAHAMAMFHAAGDKSYLQALAPSERDASMLFAALNDIKISGASQVGTNITIPQWLGKVWEDAAYLQKVVPLMRQQVLTSLDLKGWDWNLKPAGGDWAGNKTNVPSNQFTTRAVTGTAERWAMGHDHAREFEDFPQPGYWESYFQAGTDNFLEWEDLKALAFLYASAEADVIEAGAPPATWTDGDVGTLMVVDGALALNRRNITPQWALIGDDLFRGTLLQNDNAVIETLSLSLNLKGGELENFALVPVSSVEADGTTPSDMAGKVLVGSSQAASHFRLPGVPIRTRALDQIHGGIDDAMFGYAANVLNKAQGLQLVTAPVEGP